MYNDLFKFCDNNWIKYKKRKREDLLSAEFSKWDYKIEKVYQKPIYSDVNINEWNNIMIEEIKSALDIK